MAARANPIPTAINLRGGSPSGAPGAGVSAARDADGPSWTVVDTSVEAEDFIAGGSRSFGGGGASGDAREDR
jgi:hypothetical protein